MVEPGGTQPTDTLTSTANPSQDSTEPSQDSTEPSQGTANLSQCTATLKNGKPCTYKAKPGTDSCAVHCQSDECSVCLETLRAPKRLKCGHAFHLRCLRKWFGMGEVTCPMCRSPCLLGETDIAPLPARLSTFVAFNPTPPHMHYSEHLAVVLNDCRTHEALGISPRKARLLYEIMLQSFSMTNFLKALQQCGF